jgi:hypothetical protein
MKQVKVTIEGVAPLGFSKHYEVPKLSKESHNDFEERTWRNRAHTDKEGQIIIPAIFWKNCLRDVGSFLGQKIPGRQNEKYTKHFLSGILVTDPCPLGIHINDVEFEKLFVPSDGKTGGGKRVWKHFPVVHQWSATPLIYILDDTITIPVFEHHFREAGRYIGIGFWRPARGGIKGRFEILKFEWLNNEEE